MSKLGKTLIIANPAAQNGGGAKAAEIAAGVLIEHCEQDSIDLAMTESARHAERIAENMTDYDTVLALGGDGVIHEVVNGLMQRPATRRPHFGVIPSGSGNDFAKTLGMETDLRKACEQLLTLDARPTDVGCVNGHYFAETLSFGLDAAIALGTVEKRILTGRTGLALYASSALDQLRNNYKFYDYTMTIDGSTTATGRSITFAIQNGPYYGGGFMICPDARVDDDLLSVCISHPPASKINAVRLFVLAKGGKHINAKQFEFFEAQTIDVHFHDEPPCQMDGERLEGTDFHIEIAHNALNVLREDDTSEQSA